MALRRNNNRYNQRRNIEPEHKINGNIRVPEVRVIGENANGEVFTIQKANQLAEEMGLDLVMITEKAVPPVCRLVDYKKFLYEQKKKQKELKSKQVKVVIKEIRFGPQTDDHDYEFKRKHAEKFLKDGAKLKAYVFFKGRSIVFKDQGQILLLKLAQDLEEWGKLEGMPKLEGKRMIMMIAPKNQPKK